MVCCEEHKLVSLWDMIEFCLRNLLNHLEALQRFIEGPLLDEMKRGRKHSRLSPAHLVFVLAMLDELTVDCIRLELAESRNRIRGIKLDRLLSSPPYSYELVSHALRNLYDCIVGEVKQCKFAYIPDDRSKYFERAALFGRRVFARFPSLRSEIRSAGNCYAAELHAGTVFYLMRVAERGMKKLARQLQVKTVKVNVPLDEGTWREILKALLEKKISQESTARSKKRTDDLRFYGDLIMALEGFKPLRDAVSHDRARFTKGDSESAMRYVGDFMKRLAERVSE